jgi:protein-disulfide isomerase
MTELQKNNNLWPIIIACLAAGGVIGYGASHMKKEEPAAALTEERVKDIVDKYILDNPETLVRSLQSLQAKQFGEQKAAPSVDLKDKHDELYNNAQSPVVGPEDAKVTVVEFFDYHCGYCKRMFPVIKKLLAENKDVRVIFKELPILAPDSREASKAALAVSVLAPEKYFEFHEKLMEHRGNYDLATLKKFAGDMGVDGAKLEEEMNKSWVNDQLTKVSSLAQSIGVQGTPAMVIGDEIVPGAIDYQALAYRVKVAEGLAEKK